MGSASSESEPQTPTAGSAPATAQLEALLTHPREELDIELKSWLDLSTAEGKSNLAKAILALANHGGGYVLLGFAEQPNGVYLPAPAPSPTLAGYDQDTINGIVQAYADPPFHCSVYNAGHPDSGQLYPIIAVPGGHKVPIQAKKGSPEQKNKGLMSGRYYIRRQGPQSAEPATAEEWRALVMRCVRAGKEELLDAMRDVLAGRPSEWNSTPEPTQAELLKAWAADGVERWRAKTADLPSYASARLPHGHCQVTCSILGSFPRISLSNLRETLDRSTINHSGWPPWWVPRRQEDGAFSTGDALECFHGMENSRPDLSDFWRVSAQGNLLFIRGYWEDSADHKFVAGTVFDLTSHIRQIGECFLNIESLAFNLGAETGDALVMTTWDGLAGRRLIDLSGQRGGFSPLYRSRENKISLSTQVQASQIGSTLPEIIYDLLEPLYEMFNFFKISKAMVEEELRRLRSRRY